MDKDLRNKEVTPWRWCSSRTGENKWKQSRVEGKAWLLWNDICRCPRESYSCNCSLSVAVCGCQLSWQIENSDPEDNTAWYGLEKRSYGSVGAICIRPRPSVCLFHTTQAPTPFENKVWELYYYNLCCGSSSLYSQSLWRYKMTTIDHILTHLHMALILSIIQQSWYHFCADFLHDQIFGDNLPNTLLFSCLNFWDEAWWFLSLSIFWLLSSSLLLFPQCFGRYVLRPSSGVCRTQEPSRNFEVHPLLNPRGLPVQIPLTITGYKCSVFLYCYSPAVRIEPATSRWFSP